MGERDEGGKWGVFMLGGGGWNKMRFWGGLRRGGRRRTGLKFDVLLRLMILQHIIVYMIFNNIKIYDYTIICWNTIILNLWFIFSKIRIDYLNNIWDMTFKYHICILTLYIWYLTAYWWDSPYCTRSWTSGRWMSHLLIKHVGMPFGHSYILDQKMGVLQYSILIKNQLIMPFRALLAGFWSNFGVFFIFFVNFFFLFNIFFG